MVMNPCKKNQDKAIEFVCEKIGGEYYGPSGKNISIVKPELEMVFLEYDKNTEGLKEINLEDIDLNNRVKMYQAIVVANMNSTTIKYPMIEIRFPLKILINVSIVNRKFIECDGELKVESVMEVIRLFKSDIIGTLYDKALEDLDFKDNAFEKIRSAREIQ